MLYWLLFLKLQHYVAPFRIFRYVTFRTAFASLTALFLCVALGPWLIGKLRPGQHEFAPSKCVLSVNPVNRGDLHRNLLVVRDERHFGTNLEVQSLCHAIHDSR